MSPSEEVDTVWHEHLTYTRSYWEEFCGRVLRQTLHHEPTRGGPAEAEKFRDWYGRTLASYERFFGTPPPPDLWPPPQPSRFDLSRSIHRIISSLGRGRRLHPRQAHTVLRIAAVGAIAATLAGCVTLTVDLGPLDLSGLEFLKLYGFLAIAAIGIGLFLRQRAREAGQPEPDHLRPMDSYSIALLSGRDVATHAAIAQLVQHGELRIDRTNRKLKADDVLTGTHHPLELAVHERIHARGGVTPREAQTCAIPVLQGMEEELRANGLLVPESATRMAAFQSAALCAAVLIFGIIKIFIGLDRGRPVGFLFVGSMVMLIATILFLAKRPRRRRAADELLNALRKEHAPLRRTPLGGVPAFGDAALPLAVGLFGYGVLEHTQAAELRKIIAPPADATAGGGCGSGCSSSSGGGDSGGGDSGGGGSCGGGGGGCGGCGGGGGD